MLDKATAQNDHTCVAWPHRQVIKKSQIYIIINSQF
jgi:hypothetical protein